MQGKYKKIKGGITVDNGGNTFKKFKSSLNKGISTISTMTSNTIEKSKLSTQIDTLEKEIQKIYMSIGEDIYLQWKSDENKHQEFSQKFEEISFSQEKVHDLTTKLNSIGDEDNQE